MNSPVERSSEAITTTFNQWLIDEVATSSIDRNSYLDDYAGALKGLSLGYGDTNNPTYAKHSSHLDRLPIWWEAFSNDPTDDTQTGKIIFGALMFVSGAFRKQCYLQAQGTEDYTERRKQAIGIPLRNAVDVRSYTHLPSTGNFRSARITIEQLEERRIGAEKQSDDSLRRMLARTAAGYDIGAPDSISVREMKMDQYNWATFAVDCVIFAAKIRKGTLKSVPVLEPVTITDNPGVYYPFRGERPSVLSS